MHGVGQRAVFRFADKQRHRPCGIHSRYIGRCQPSVTARATFREPRLASKRWTRTWGTRLGGWGYDSQGNLTSVNGYVYNDFNLENQWTYQTTYGVHYYYDGDGVREKASGGASTRVYSTDETGQVVVEYNQNGTVQNEYLYFNGMRMARVYQLYGGTYYYYGDALQTSRLITDSSGNKCYDADYFPWGAEQHVYTNTCPQNYKFTGKERDPDMLTDYFGARFYKGDMSRFYSPDWSADVEPVPYAKLDNPQSLNLYTYVNDNPTTFRDPDGHDLESPAAFAGIRSDASMQSASDVEAAQIRREAEAQQQAQNQRNSAEVNTIYNETSGLRPDPSSDPNSAQNLDTARQNAAHVYENTNGNGFQAGDTLSGREQSAIKNGSPDAVAGYESSQKAVAAAHQDRTDPTQGATHIYIYDLSPNSTQHVPAWVTNGNPTTVQGPFINAAGGGDVSKGAPVLVITIKEY